MTLLPTLNDQIARARTDLRLGLPVVLQDRGHLALIFAAEGLTDALLQTTPSRLCPGLDRAAASGDYE